ncbi:hypothetical protein, conserved [Eimeria praecox]|uniref:Uncharacterized protein n=1 Tax=Eimeria praecox TaxID=51316 RepID=U6G3R5_9EIME|nr:hypothetical protein, conserved [Eimeria praecox]
MDAQASRGLSMIGDGSVLLEVAGQFTVPNVSSKEELQEVLLNKKYVLDLRRTEIRMSDSVKKEVYKALGLEEDEGIDVMKSIFLNGSITNAPLGTHELVHCFLRRGTREHHFSLLRELAKRRRADLESDAAKKDAARQQRIAGRKIAKEQIDREGHGAESPSSGLIFGQKEADLSVAVTSGTAGEGAGHEKPRTKERVKGAAVAARSGGEGNNYLAQPHEELTTFRSATTASELGTSR